MDDAPGIARVHVASWRATCATVLPPEVLAGLDVEAYTTRWAEILDAGRVSCETTRSRSSG